MEHMGVFEELPYGCSGYEKVEAERYRFVLVEVGQNDWTWGCDKY
jgi:hypothetical protein